MKAMKQRDGAFVFFLLLIGVIISGLVFCFKGGISGNDFWWHVKAGEWIFNHQALPGVDVFSWYAAENGIHWMPQEWLSEVVFYIVHHFFGNGGIFILSLCAALSMMTLIFLRNKRGIQNNILLSMLLLLPGIKLFSTYFYGRPQIFSFFLLFAALSCLYRYKADENSKAIYFVPVIALLWSNLHAGTVPLLYVLCLIFALTGIFDFTSGRLKGEKLSKKQLLTYLLVGGLSVLMTLLNPNGYKALIYPFVNIGDTFMQAFIAEWAPPDAKNWSHLLIFFLPVIVVTVAFIVSKKEIKLVDLGLFLFFAYLFFRSTRFSMLFFVGSTFFAFDYFAPLSLAPLTKRKDYIKYVVVFAFLIGVNIYGVVGITQTARQDQLISVELDDDFITLIKKENPAKLFHDYNYGESLIYNDIGTFVDAREDLFAKANLKDAARLIFMQGITDDDTFDPEVLIDAYGFDAFVVSANRPLTFYLKSKPEKYHILLEQNGAVYFEVIRS